MLQGIRQALAEAIHEDQDVALTEVVTALKEHGIRMLLVAVDDVNPAPFVESTIAKRDITVPMVQGFVYTLLNEAGVPKASAQASAAASFVVRYVKANMK